MCGYVLNETRDVAKFLAESFQVWKITLETMLKGEVAKGTF